MNVKTRLTVALALSMLVGALAQGQQNPASAELLAQFKRTTVFWQQFEVAKRLTQVADPRILKELEPWLVLEDRHLRGNAAFVFASLGDPRGFETIRAMLTDRSSRPVAQGIPGVAGTLSGLPASQIRADRYYAAHLFGELKNPHAVDALVPLLDDVDINYHVAWALGEIGDPRAIPPLIAALKDRDALVRVSAIQALEKLNATEALPELRKLLNDQAIPSAGDRVSVGETARAAIAKLQSPNNGLQPTAPGAIVGRRG